MKLDCNRSKAWPISMSLVDFPSENIRIRDISWVSGGAKKGNRVESISKSINGRFPPRVQAEVLFLLKIPQCCLPLVKRILTQGKFLDILLSAWMLVGYSSEQGGGQCSKQMGTFQLSRVSISTSVWSAEERRGGLTLPNGTFRYFQKWKIWSKTKLWRRGRGWESCVLGCHIIVTILKTK